MIALRFLLFAVILLVTAGCAQDANPPPTRLVPTRMPTVLTAATQAPPEPAVSDWLVGDAGMELRTFAVAGIVPETATPVHVLRFDPATVRLRVAYTPDNPQPLRTWVLARQPLAAINGGFFTPEFAATALIVSDGAAHGASYEGFGGMLTVGPDGAVTIQVLRDAPYDPAQPLDQAIQSFPILVYPGGIAADIADDGQRARRTVVALDRAGRMLLIVCPTSAFSLRGLADWLAGSELEIDRALNFDGGSSSGMFVLAGDLRLRIDSFGVLPAVLLVERR